MSQLPRAMTAPELGLIRTDVQFSSLYLCIHKPAVVYSAILNQVFTSNDEVAQITYSSGSGTLANILPGMTLWVGTTAGACDLGQCRIRSTPTSSILYIGENSDIDWVDNNGCYLTIMDEFGIWQRNLTIDTSNVAYMDYNIAYTDQHLNCSPVPILGPRLVPVWLAGATVTVSFDGSLSYVIGSTIASHSWSFPGASATSGLATATPTATYNAVGTYRFSDTQTTTNGKITTGYGYVQVFDYNANLPINQFDLTSNIKGARTQGGWSFSVRMYAQADFLSIVDRAQVCLFARDFYGTTEVSIGPITGRENIIAIGWIDGESIVEDPDGSYIDFTVEGIGLWMKKMTQFPIGIQNSTTAATAWTSWNNLTVDDSLYHLFYWQSTIIPTVDVFLTGDTRNSAQQYAPGQTTLYDQLTYLLKNTILGDACSDRFNRLFCEIDEQLTPPANRSSIPSVMTLQYYDWRDQLSITRIPVPVTSQVNLSGVAIAYPNNPLAYFSLAPGHDPLRWGTYKAMTSILLTDQSSSNQLAAMQLAWDNHQLEFSIDLGGNNRMVDIVPHQFVSTSVVSTDTPRGFSYSGHIIVREVSMSWDQSSKDDSNFLQISWTTENETFPGNSSNGDVPVSNTPATLGIPALPALPPLPLINPTPTGAPSVVVMGLINYVAGENQVWYTLNPNAADPTQVHWLLMINGIVPTDLAYIINMVVSPITGECWLVVDGDTSGTGNLIYYAPQLGASWNVKMTQLQGYTLIGGGDGRITSTRCSALGINPSSPDEVMAIIGYMGADGGWWCHGSSAGFTKGSPVNFAGGNGVVFGNMVYGNNQWTDVQSNGAGYSAYVQWCNRSGGSANYNTNALYPTNDYLNIAHAGKDGPIFYITNAYVSTQRNNLVKSINNGVTLTDIPTAPFSSVPTTNAGIFPAPNGLTLIAPDPGGVNAQLSLDGGTTWGNLALAGAYPIFYCYGAPILWLAQGAHTVKYTTDTFVTTVDITGDLQNQIGVSGNWTCWYLIGW